MSNEDPSVIKYIITSDEYDRLKHFEVKCQELFEEIRKLKELSSKSQTGKGDYFVVTESKDEKTPVLNIVPNSDEQLINFSVPLIKNDDNDDFDEESLLYLVPQEHKNKAHMLLSELKSRGNELTWNSSGIVFINQIAIPNTNIFYLFPYLFQKHLPKKKIEGFTEVQGKLINMGLSNYLEKNENMNSLSINPNNFTGNGLDSMKQSETVVVSNHWYFIG